MGKYDVDRALQVAIEMERMGKTLYESLAMGCGDPQIARLATELAKAETSHMEFFKRMRSALRPSERGPQVTEKELYEAARELRGKLMPDVATVRKAVLAADISSALDMAMNMEAAAVSASMIKVSKTPK